MIQLLRNYLSVRVSPLYFLLVAIWIFLFSVPLAVVDVFSFFDVMKIVLVLIGLRLYDDVIQSDDDSMERLKLPMVLILSLSALSWLKDGLDLSMMWVYFFVINHILYKALGHRGFWAFVLPAVQYPIIVLALTYTLWKGMIDLIYLFSAVSIFLSALVLQWLEYSEDRLQPIWIYLFSCFVVTIALVNLTVPSLIAAIGAVFCLLILFLFCKRKMHLWWAIIVLLMQGVAYNVW